MYAINHNNANVSYLRLTRVYVKEYKVVIEKKKLGT